MVKHARGGTFAARALVRGNALGVEMLAIDRGCGMASFSRSSRDGVSTAGTPGTGLGAIKRLTDAFDAYTRTGAGTILRMVVWNRDGVPTDDEYEVGGISIPKTGESVCGDAWGFEGHPQGGTLLMADGLGHGPEASRASALAVDVLRKHAGESAVRVLDIAHGKLRATRGAAMAVLRHERATREIVFAGVGNIAACVLNGGERRTMVSHNGIVGHNIPRSQEYRYSWPAKSLLVAHSDGLESQWSLAAYPGIAECHASLIAAMLFREHSRGRDDVAVVVIRHLH
jgi:hypothetical protein